jgi:hypothetical protein
VCLLFDIPLPLSFVRNHTQLRAESGEQVITTSIVLKARTEAALWQVRGMPLAQSIRTEHFPLAILFFSNAGQLAMGICNQLVQAVQVHR